MFMFLWAPLHVAFCLLQWTQRQRVRILPYAWLSGWCSDNDYGRESGSDSIVYSMSGDCRHWDTRPSIAQCENNNSTSFIQCQGYCRCLPQNTERHMLGQSGHRTLHVIYEYQSHTFFLFSNESI